MPKANFIISQVILVSYFSGSIDEFDKNTTPKYFHKTDTLNDTLNDPKHFRTTLSGKFKTPYNKVGICSQFNRAFYLKL